LTAHRQTVADLETLTVSARQRSIEKNEAREVLQGRLRERERGLESSRLAILRLLGESSTLKNQLAQVDEYLAGIERETLRVTREEEHYIGRARPGLTSRIKVGFRKDGKITAIDLFVIAENGPYDQQGDARSAGNTISLCYQPTAMRWRGISVLTNTPPKTSQRAPGGMQGIGIMEPVISKAGRKLGIDQVEIHKINAPAGKAKFGPAAARGQQAYVTSAFVREALDKGAELFKWDEKKARSGKRTGTKVRGSGVAVSAFSGGSTGFDGLFIIRPDGKVQFQSGIGNLGTHSVMDVHRVAAEMLDVPWEQCEVVWGNTSKNLPWTCISAGSQTTHAMTRAAHAAATDGIQKLKEVAAKTLGGSPESY